MRNCQLKTAQKKGGKSGFVGEEIENEDSWKFIPELIQSKPQSAFLHETLYSLDKKTSKGLKEASLSIWRVAVFVMGFTGYEIMEF